VIGRSAVLAAFIALLTAGAATAAVERGVFTPNQGARGIKLGMTRAQVIAKLGLPLFENKNGFMEYSRNNLFDIYLNKSVRPHRVDLIGIAGPGFCLAGTDLCLGDRGGVGFIQRKYGDRLKLEEYQSGDVYALYGTYKGCRALTEFLPNRFKPSSPIGMVFIGYEPEDC
jgi:hypothetical protein